MARNQSLVAGSVRILCRLTATGTKFAEILWMTSSLDRGPDRCPNPLPQHSSSGSPNTVHKKSGRFSSLASFRPSLTSPSQGICCHLFAAADGLIMLARLANSAGLGRDFFASVCTWACMGRAVITRTATQSNQCAPEMKLVDDMILSPGVGRLIVGES